MNNTIVDFTGIKHVLNGCLGCEIFNGHIKTKSGTLYQSKNFFVTQDFELPIDGFLIITPIRHVEQFTQLNEEEQLELITLSNKLLTILKKYDVCQEYNIILEEKAGIHLHLWLMPRHKWMLEKFGKVIKSIKQIQEYSLEYMQTKENIIKVLQTCEIVKKEMNK